MKSDLIWMDGELISYEAAIVHIITPTLHYGQDIGVKVWLWWNRDPGSTAYFAKCTGENLFMIQNGVLFTPPCTEFLECITRDTVLKIAADLEIPKGEEQTTRDLLYTADEIFITVLRQRLSPSGWLITGKLGKGSQDQSLKPCSSRLWITSTDIAIALESG